VSKKPDLYSLNWMHMKYKRWPENKFTMHTFWVFYFKSGRTVQISFSTQTHHKSGIYYIYHRVSISPPVNKSICPCYCP
jgi:hypothetical protein